MPIFKNKLMKKILKIFLFVLLGLISVATIYLFVGPELPNQTDEVITDITSKKLQN